MMDYMNLCVTRNGVEAIMSEYVELVGRSRGGTMLGQKTNRSLAGLMMRDHPVHLFTCGVTRVFIEPDKAAELCGKLNERGVHVEASGDWEDVKWWSSLCKANKACDKETLIEALAESRINEFRVLGAGMNSKTAHILDYVHDQALQVVDVTSEFLVLD